jgi:hypothetical protein
MDATIFLDTHKDLSTWDILFSPSKKKKTSQGKRFNTIFSLKEIQSVKHP